MTLVLIAWAVALIPYLIYLRYKLKRDLHVLQLKLYERERYLRWFRENRKENFRVIELLPVLSILPIFANTGTNLEILIYKGLFAISYIILIIRREKYTYKKKLVMTPRAKRLFSVAKLIIFVGILAILFAYVEYFNSPGVYKLYAITVLELLLLIEFTCASFMPILFANVLLASVEKKEKIKYHNRAVRLLDKMKGLKVIGITGSYGKTTTKMIVADILSAKYNVCITPKSFSTFMGVVRSINEKIHAEHEIFLVEMGAKKIGDIKEICELVHPHHGIITAIGPEHLEGLRSIENVKTAKYELALSVNKGGKVLFNIDDEHIKDIVLNENISDIQHETTCYSIGNEDAEYHAHDIKYTKNGTNFILVDKGQEVRINTKLIGKYNIRSIVAGYTLAKELGMEVDEILKGIESVKMIENKMEVKNNDTYVEIIDDSYLANSKSVHMALETLKAIDGNKKILVTSGMQDIEENLYDANNKFVESAVDLCDYIILVGETETAHMKQALKGKMWANDKLYIAKNMEDAKNHISEFVKENDIVLYELEYK